MLLYPSNPRGQKSLGPLKMSLEMAHKVIVPQKKNYVTQFLKQRDINSYYSMVRSDRLILLFSDKYKKRYELLRDVKKCILI